MFFSRSYVMKYLYYDIKERVGSGLNDRKCVVSILLEEARANDRIAVIPRFKLSKGHNNDKQIFSQILEDYVILDDPRYKYTLDLPKDATWKTILDEDIPEEETFVKRRFKAVWYCKTWNKYENVSFVTRNSLFKPTDDVRRMGEAVLKDLRSHGKRTVGVHLRKGDRMSSEEKTRMSPEYIFSMTKHFDCPIYVATNEPKFVHESFKTYRDFPELSNISDNYLLFAVEMYVVEQCDVHIKTFIDSEHMYGSVSKEKYYLIPRSMHIHDDKQRNSAYTPEDRLYQKYS